MIKRPLSYFVHTEMRSGRQKTCSKMYADFFDAISRLEGGKTKFSGKKVKKNFLVTFFVMTGLKL